jgi:hypothetical protein
MEPNDLAIWDKQVTQIYMYLVSLGGRNMLTPPLKLLYLPHSHWVSLVKSPRLRQISNVFYSSDDKEKRVAHRVLSIGEKPYLDKNSSSRREALGGL